MPNFDPHGSGLVITPDMEAGATCEALGVTLEDVLDELRARQEMKRATMRRRMALAQAAGGERRILKGEVGGAVDMMIDPVSYHYWGNRLGYECWDDRQFVAEYKRDNPECRVRLRGTPGLETRAMQLNKAGATARGYRLNHRGPVGRRGRWAN
ncbi:MAG TPA: hypothetical protein VEB22_03700 [Phycisphaerales bacterium]|nr:hypothetical protein [Phycisphaerales bacterium]